MERKLAHIEMIEWIKPIEGADQIELCGIIGWQCIIAKKDNFKIGDFVVYCEVDSVMPEKPEFEFLRDRKFRIRTIKLRGQISQGLVLPISILGTRISPNIGEDVTAVLGITKYLSPTEQDEIQKLEDSIKLERNRLKKFMMRYSWFRRLFLSRKQKNGFPYWVQKTDEERIQNLGDSFVQRNIDKEVYITEKIDYQSATFTSKIIPRFDNFIGKFFKKIIFVVCSRNFTTNDKNSLYWQIAKKYNLEEICKENPGIVIQGEQGNTKVQGNKYGLKELKMWVFNIIDSNDGHRFSRYEMEWFCYRNNLDIVPLISICNMSDIGTTVSDFVEYSKGNSVLSNIKREGIVIRSNNPNDFFSFKVINPEFLLKYE
jgi:hypothetical protein